jgi:hypothetical protein
MPSQRPFQILWITWHGHFTATHGRVRNLASLTRISDISLEYDTTTGSITVFGNLGLTELRVSPYPVSPFLCFRTVRVDRSLAISTVTCRMTWVRFAASGDFSCKIWGIHSGEYEERRLLWYKNPLCTSQETHYVSTTEPGQLMLCKIWGIHSGEYEERRLLWYKNPLCTSQETHYVYTTEPGQLMLCKILCFHSGEYEEFRLLRYRNSVRTSQETHYVSATDSSQLMLFKIWGIHSGEYEELRLLRYKNPDST